MMRGRRIVAQDEGGRVGGGWYVYNEFLCKAAGTQHYLHLTVELFPEVMERVNQAFADVIPRRNPS